MTDAQSRGWGNPRAKDFRRLYIVPVTAGGVTVQVHKDVAPLVQGFLTEITKRGYKLNARKDDWGYCLRANRNNPAVLSNHSWGIAVDLNATTNPNTHDGRVHTDMPAWVVEAGQRWGLSWGGHYRGRTKDPMHFEWLGTRADVEAKVKALNVFFASLTKKAG